MFGSFGAQPAAQPAASGFSFGAPAAGSSTSAFGSSSTPATGGFGAPAAQPASTGFSFGGAATTQPATSFGGFGAAASTPAAGSTGGFGFGSTSSTATTASSTPSSGFSFGATPAAAPASTGAFSFGGSTTPSTSTPSTGFSFGGAAATPSTPSTSTFSFGGNNTTAAPATGGFGSGFGSTSTSSFSFGNAAAKPSGFGGFGAAAPAAPASGLFQLNAASSTNAFPGATNALAAATSAAANSPMESLTGIRMAYMDPQQSRFKHMLYNAVDPAQKHLYVRPAHISEKLWTQAQRDNPDPANCVPAAVIGFKELSTRIKLQQEHADKFATYAEDMVTQVKEMEKTSRETDVKLAQCRHQHVALFHRLIQLMRKLEVFKNLRKPLHADEVKLLETLKKVASMLDNPTQFKARMNELMALQAMQAAKPHPDQEQCQLSEQDLHLVFGIMDRQRQGLEHVTKVLSQDMRDVEIMQKALADDEY
ncbi:hypothetical protein SPRG_19970 [Saprolegnia parasitica CBS 223.65]|uniref:Nucleoporin Nup54 alpha-helical domain-containing protein n=1 Tax=Saprolegnia parasitica (strain CBS 223.65) TaxID=695850 RepID=A0A067CQG4_SAPPC|nr:hypothetical protein SPRG_19970 [Saprolegnia parasitica CBS 223.65]KDO28756.1 hypothetical protein SPRG_19970 [Saprolegnia parasitica CBS 223.65]|eukprot:XP_012200502.1 hypothetical protein SPRG_19970 [Saprolegnia parasitica CBS 223.65]